MERVYGWKEQASAMSVRDTFVWSALLLFVFLATKVVYRLFFSPLRNVPGPFIAKVTGQWALYLTFCGNRARKVHELHQKYGPVLQLGPNELSFSSLKAIDTIHATNTSFCKGFVYESMGPPSMFNLRNLAAHKERRRRMNHAFALQHIYDMESEFYQSLNKLTAVIDRHGGKPVDVKHWFKMYTLDNAGRAFLGLSFDGLDSEETPQYAKDLDVLFPAWAAAGLFPITSWILKRIPHPKLDAFFGANDRAYKYGDQRLKQYIQKYGRFSRRKDLLTKMIGSKENDPDSLPDKDVSVEVTNLCFAATDTTAISLVFLFLELGRNPALVNELREELADAPLVDGVVQHKHLGQCRLLDATLNESMRMHPIAPSGLPRETPPGGFVVDDIRVPAGTIVGTNTWSSHYDPNYFPDPYKFDPSRWLGEVSDEMKGRWMPFSKGPLNCIGQPMALFEMKILAATLIKKYNITNDASMTGDAVDFADYFLMVFPGEKCPIKFTPV